MISSLSILYNYFRIRYGRPFRSREELLAWQDRRVQEHLRRILPKSPFYQRQFRDHSPAEWQDAPIMNKAMMMDNFDTLNTVGIKKQEAFALALRAEQSRDFSPMINGITVGLSSGTSGSRGLFLVSPAERTQWAGTVLAKVWPGSIFARQRVAFFLRANSNLYHTIQSKRIQFEYFDLLEPLTSHLIRLNSLQPTVLVAPPSMLRLLAQAIARTRITPRKVISVAEVLDPLDERVIRQQFGQIVHQIYQCTEGFLGSTCRYGTLHLAEDCVVIQKEYLNVESRQFVPIITDFQRTSQPIIRYRLDDILTERATPCPCGSLLTALEQIEGRCDDIFYLPASDGSHSLPIFPDFIRRAIITSSPHLEAYFARQQQPDLLEIALSAPDAEMVAIQSAITEGIAQLCTHLHCQVPQIRYTTITPSPLTRKLKRVERLFEINGEFHDLFNYDL